MDLKAQAWVLLLLLSAVFNAYTADMPDVENSEEEDITTVILRMNNGSIDKLLEGDLFVPTTRTALKCLNTKYSCFWPKTKGDNVEIPFVISDEYDNAEKSKILLAMDSFKDNTCIRFVPYKGERAYLSIEPKFGCYSLLGRIGERQLVSLQRFGCVDFGIIQHELLHALGFYHEHNRSDRDQYVIIHWDKINENLWKNFKKMDTDNLTPYDYSSVMQYGKTAFGIRGAETITPIPDPNVPIGQRSGMSKADINRVNILYKCRRQM